MTSRCRISHRVVMALGIMLRVLPVCLAQAEQVVSPQPQVEQIAAAILQTRREIERDTAELNRIREEIAAVRQPLAGRLEMLQATVAGKRAEAARLRRFRQQGDAEQEALAAQTDSLQETTRFLIALFTEYARAMETRVNAAEAPLLAEKLRPLAAALNANELTDTSADGIGKLLALSEQWNRRRLGGHVFAGNALDTDGIEMQGRFVAFGPIAYFAGANGPAAGSASTRFGRLQPGVDPLFDAATAEAVQRVIDGQQAVLPVDVTGGDANRIAQARTGLIAHARRGGPVMIPLLAVAFAAAVLVLLKIFEIGRFRIRGAELMPTVMARLRCGDISAAGQAARLLKEPLASLAATVIAHHDASRERLEEILHEMVLETLRRLERYLGILAVLGGVAPLLGLLGTVTGMIHTFQLVTLFGTGDARLLSGGISEALTTTAFGLIIAVPVLLAHAFLARWARTRAGILEQHAVAVLNDRMQTVTPPAQHGKQ